MNTVIGAVGPFWFVVLSVLAIGGPLVAFSIGFAIAKRLRYSVVGIILTMLCMLLSIGPALGFMFTQWTISAEYRSGTDLIFSQVGWVGVCIAIFWIVGCMVLGFLIEGSD